MVPVPANSQVSGGVASSFERRKCWRTHGATVCRNDTGLHAVFLVMLLVVVPVLSRSEPAQLEKALLEARDTQPSVSVLSAMLVAATNAPNASARDEALKACGAGLLYLDRIIGYTARVRPLVPGVLEFEKSMQAPCEACEGHGKIPLTCPECKGKGICTAFRCSNGEIHLPGFDGREDVHPCTKCGGTAVCQRCKGSRTIMVQCAVCKGAGVVFSRDAALGIYRTSIEEALSLLRDRSRQKEDRVSGRSD